MLGAGNAYPCDGRVQVEQAGGGIPRNHEDRMGIIRLVKSDAEEVARVSMVEQRGVCEVNPCRRYMYAIYKISRVCRKIE